MCGICGKLYFDSKRNVEIQLIENMAKTMSHRGPDGSGTYISGCIGLGHRRLAIIDLDTGKQPLSNEDDQIWIVYNGEIYNYKELRTELINKGHIFKTKTDTEVILHLYEDMGEQCISELRGMFAFALWDNRKRKLFLARDRVGIKPIYYTVTRDSFLFASEIKALLQDPSVEKAINPSGIHNFLCCTFTPAPEIVFQNIFKLQPGHFLTIENGKKSVKQYWDIQPYFSLNSANKKNLESNFLDLLTNTVKIHMISDVPVGFLLSGGVDSTAMLNFYQEGVASDIKAFTVGFESEQFEDERKYARIAARRYGVDHYEMSITSKNFFEFLPKYIWFMEEPIFEPPGVSLFYITKMARKYVKVLISGEGGDEAFAGYQTYRNLVWLERIKKILGPLQKDIALLIGKTANAFSFNPFHKYGPLINLPLQEYYYTRAFSPVNLFYRNLHQLYSPDFYNTIDAEGLRQVFGTHFKSVNSISNLNKMLYIDTKTWLPDRLLLKADKMTMANSLELRVPLLDHKVLEFAATMPDRLKLNGITTKYFFKKILKDRLPKEITKRKKAGFPIPYAKWLYGNQSIVLDVLMDRKTTERGLFDRKKIEDLILKKWRHTGVHSMEIFNLLTLELWYRTFIDSDNKVTI